MGKILSLDELEPVLGLQRSLGRKIVLCHGVFDLFHPGHLEHLEEAKSLGDILVVTITPDKYVNKGPGTPRFNEKIRMKMVASKELVDYVALSETPTAVEIIQRLKPTFYCKGSDYNNQSSDITGKIKDEREAVELVGGQLHITHSKINYSSTSLLNQYFDVFPRETREFLSNFRKKFPLEPLLDRLDSLKNLKVLVIGDTIIDHYIYCSMLGASPKDNIVTARYIGEETFAGGVLAVANNISALCNNVKLVTIVGPDGWEPFIREHLKEEVSMPEIFIGDLPTVVKTKYVEPDSLTKMFGITSIGDRPHNKELRDRIRTYLDKYMRDFDFIVVCDFGHGLIDTELAEFLSSEAKYLVANAQTNSANMGFNPITRYLSADYISIDELELRLANKDRFSRIEGLMVELRHLLGCKLLTITRGKHGSLTLEAPNNLVEVPSLSVDIVDRVGAGDAFLAMSAPCAFKEFEPEVVGFIGNVAGALKVRTVNNKEPISKIQLYKYITTLLK